MPPKKAKATKETKDQETPDITAEQRRADEETHYAAAQGRARHVHEAIRDAVEKLSPDDPEVRWRYDILAKNLPGSNQPVTIKQSMVKGEAKREAGTCVSCHGPLDKDYPWRCPPCIKALHLARAAIERGEKTAASVIRVPDGISFEDLGL
jgi:hypothetical protein